MWISQPYFLAIIWPETMHGWELNKIFTCKGAMKIQEWLISEITSILTWNIAVSQMISGPISTWSHFNKLINMITFQQTGKMMLRYILGAACDVCGFVGLQTLHSSAGLCVILYNTCIGKWTPKLHKTYCVLKTISVFACFTYIRKSVPQYSEWC